MVKIYEKIKSGIRVYNGKFSLVDAQADDSSGRIVYKFKLRIIDQQSSILVEKNELEHNRMIPSKVKLMVWKRDS